MATTYTYKGTAITKMSTTPREFNKSGIDNAKVNDTYLNTEKGHVYKCTTGGSPSKAKWKYVETVVIGKPETGVTSLGSPKRVTVSGNNHYMQADWKVPNKLLKKTNGRRATGMTAQWKLDLSSADKTVVNESSNEKLATSKINLNNLSIGNKVWTRSSFYPNGTKLYGVSVTVFPTNEEGNGKVKQTTSYKFNLPRAPKIGSWSFNTSSGAVSNTITTDAGTDSYERYDTRYQMIITDTTSSDSPWNEYDTNSTSTSISLSYNVSNYQSLSYDDYVAVTIKAWARGYAGSSSETKNKAGKATGAVSKTYYVAYPTQVTIEDVEVSSRDTTGKCTVHINTNKSNAHPIDGLKLEYLANVTYSTAALIPDVGWTESGSVDDGNCTAMAMDVSSLIPDPGKYTWVRVKSYHANEAVLKRYSEPWRVTQLETPAATATDESVDILDTEAGADGESIIVKLGWNADGLDDSTGTELSWSDAADSWKSTDEPDKYDFTWSDGPVTSGTTTYQDSATITIKGLKEATNYYIKARRYLEGETMTYSPYSNTAAQLTSETPESVVATCPSFVATGASLPVSWTYSGNGVQTQWQIVEQHTVTSNNVTTTVDGPIIAQADSSLGATQVPTDRLDTFATNGVLTFTVQISTGSGFVVSDPQTIKIVEPPTLSLTANATMTAQSGYSVTATSNKECNLTVIVTSQGAVNQFPDKVKRQTTGDTIWSDVLTPEWTEGTNSYSTIVTFPQGLDFWDLASYTISAVATDPETGLASKQTEATFSVNWSHKAPCPVQQTFTATSDTTVVEDKIYYELSDGVYIEVTPEGTENPSSEGWYEMTETAYVTLTPIDVVNDDGFHRQAVQIVLSQPSGYASSDVYDIYRMTSDGVYLIGSGFPLSFTTADEYAPFGDALTQSYRLAVRTIDGDVDFADIEYVADGDKLRLDWAGGTLELPYNIQIGDKYKKDVEIRKHMDGNNDAYWNSNIDRTGSLSSDLIRLKQQEDVLSARALARYPGAVFVRTPDGSAYEADVQVSNMSTDGLLESIAVDATEIGLTNEFSLPIPFNLGD